MAALDLVKEIAQYYELKLDLNDKSATDTDFIEFVHDTTKTNLSDIESFMAYGRTNKNKRYWLDETREKLLGVCLCDIENLVDFPFTDRPEITDVRGLKFVLTGLETIEITDKLSLLEQLDLGENKNLTHVGFGAELPKLRRLEIGDCKLENVKLPACPELKYLDLARNQLATLTFAKAMPKLEFADFSMNEPLQALHLPYGFKNLMYLYCYKCTQLIDFTLEPHFNALPPSNTSVLVTIENQLPSLNILDFEGCSLRYWPENFLIPETLEALYLNGNTPQGISTEIIGRGERYNSVKDFREYIKTERTEYLLQCRLILVGNEMVGKSSIRIKLLDRNGVLPNEKQRTPGLKIEKKHPYPLLKDLIRLNNDEVKQLLKELNEKEREQIDPTEFVLNIWDFGGQSRYREIQQLFCSSRSLYLFVTSPDDNKNKRSGNLSPDDIYVGFKYWMAMIRAGSYDQNAANNYSPVIFVANKMDKGSVDLNKSSNQVDFPEIKRYVELSCTNLEDPEFNKLPKEILKELRENLRDVLSAKYDKKWIRILDKLKTLSSTQRYLTYDYYINTICQEAGFEIDQQAADTWLEAMRKLGILFVVNQKSLIIIDPDWLVEALVRIIDSFAHVNRYKSPLKRHDFDDLWAGLLIEDAHAGLLLNYMIESKLCFVSKENQDEYHVPLLLDTFDKLPKAVDGKEITELRFCFAPMLPAGTVNSLMADFHEDTEERWRNNILLFKEDCYVHISEDWEQHILKLKIYGSIKMAFFNEIVAKVKDFTDKYKTAHFLNRLDNSLQGLHKGNWVTIETENRLGDKASGFTIEDFIKGEDNLIPISVTETSKSSAVKKILIVHSNHPSQSDLKIATELKKIDDNKQSGSHREKFEFAFEPSVELSQLARKINKHQPDIIHFSMHGDSELGLFLEDGKGGIVAWHPIDVKRSFDSWSKQRGKPFDLVILSSCCSDNAGIEIFEYATDVICTKVDVKEKDAIEFANVFYGLLFDNENVSFCHSQAVNAIVANNRGKIVYKDDDEEVYVIITKDYKPNHDNKSTEKENFDI